MPVRIADPAVGTLRVGFRVGAGVGVEVGAGVAVVCRAAAVVLGTGAAGAVGTTVPCPGRRSRDGLGRGCLLLATLPVLFGSADLVVMLREGCTSRSNGSVPVDDDGDAGASVVLVGVAALVGDSWRAWAA